MVVYNILLENLLGESGVYSIDDLKQTDGVNKPEYLEMARKYNRIKACESVQRDTAVEQDIQNLYMARMLTYTNLSE